MADFLLANGKHFTLRRPISCLYPLEINPKVNPQKISDMKATPAYEYQEDDGCV